MTVGLYQGNVNMTWYAMITSRVPTEETSSRNQRGPSKAGNGQNLNTNPLSSPMVKQCLSDQT